MCLLKPIKKLSLVTNSAMIHIDNRYITALRNNEKAVIEEIYKKYAEKIKALIIKNSGTENDAADILQESLIYIYNRSLNSDFTLTCPFEAYLVMVCKNRWINELEKRKNKRVTFVDDYGFKENTAQEEGVLQMKVKEEKFALIHEALQKIGQGCAELLQLSWQGLGMEEVGQKLQMTYAYVRKKKSECMGKLIELVKNEPNYKSLI
jgi:RNA polymerase sigma factor (sigma-70 family)